MTLEDIEQQLPNGFKDAILENLEFDMQNLSIRLKFNIWIDANKQTHQETWRKGEVLLKNIAFFTISPHLSFVVSKNRQYPKLKWEVSVLDLFKGIPEDFNLDRSLIDNKHFSCFHMREENLFFRMLVSYEIADFKWLGEALVEVL